MSNLEATLRMILFQVLLFLVMLFKLMLFRLMLQRLLQKLMLQQKTAGWFLPRARQKASKKVASFRGRR
jgi:hypothetical protein